MDYQGRGGRDIKFMNKNYNIISFHLKSIFGKITEKNFMKGFKNMVGIINLINPRKDIKNK